MGKAYIDSVRVKERDHVIDTDDKTHDGCYPIGNNVGLGQIQSQDGQKRWGSQTKGSRRVTGEEVQRTEIQLAAIGEREPVGKQRQYNHPDVFPSEVTEIEAILRTEHFCNPYVSHQQEHRQIDGDNAETILLRQSNVLDEGKGEIGYCHIRIEQRLHPVFEDEKQDEHQERKRLKQTIEFSQMYLWGIGKGDRNNPSDALQIKVAAGKWQKYKLSQQQCHEELPFGRDCFKIPHFHCSVGKLVLITTIRPITPVSFISFILLS